MRQHNLLIYITYYTECTMFRQGGNLKIGVKNAALTYIRNILFLPADFFENLPDIVV